MESITPASRYIAQNSKKRVFPGGSSSSACKDVEVSENSTPIDLTSKLKSKQKEVISNGVIDIDSGEDDCDDDVMLINEKVADTNGKGKGTSSDFSVGLSLSNDATMSDIQNDDDFNDNPFYGDEDWMESFYDDIVYDDYSVLESHFDNMDIPPGVEVPVPWFPDSSTDLLSSQPIEVKDNQSFTSPINSTVQDNPDFQHMKMKLLKKSTSSSSSSSSQPSRFSSALKKDHFDSFAKGKRRSKAPHLSFSGPLGAPAPPPPQQFSYGPTFPPNYKGPGFAMNVWQSSPQDITPKFYNPAPMAYSPNYPWPQMSASPMENLLPAVAENVNVDETLHKFELFKKFDTVEDYADHHYAKNGSSTKQPPKDCARRIQEEWRSLEKDLPDTIFVRVYESRMDLLRAVIVGAEGTPYHDGLFFFDVFFPSSYPNVPPHVYYHSFGLRINPNLYNCGKVCLSLLNTWSGSHKEKWIPGVSTMLQVLVSIQGLILNAKPYFNEPGYANTMGTVSGEKRSLDYNEKTFMHSLHTMVYSMRRPPKYFEEFVLGHYIKHAREILVSCKAYLDGAQVGCLVKGGVQDVDEGDKSCSDHFKASLAGYITTLVNTFSKIGAKDCGEFLSLAQKGNGLATAVATMNLNFYN